ncbi:hypothetical protein ACIBF5_05160 [Micromonospora sp. NPDC050417]|uniref:hypothetical protein n=1 Tax=Micromonospora sp. NPDC050417 TaxID=3364280 RepID=UPI00378E2B2F
MPQIEIDDATDRLLEFAASIAGLSKGQVVARLVEQSQPAAALPPAVADGEPNPVRVHADYAGHRTQALFIPGPNRIEITSGPLADRAFRTPSEAARAIVAHYNPGVSPHRNGWAFFLVSATGASLQSLRHRAS